MLVNSFVFSTKLFTSSWSYRFKDFVYVSCHRRMLTLYIHQLVHHLQAECIYKANS